MPKWEPTLERLRAVGTAREVGRFCDAWEAVFEATGALWDQGDALTALALLRLLREDLDEFVVPDLVRGAREDGASWAEVGQALGVTRQGARQRFRASDDFGA